MSEVGADTNMVKKNSNPSDKAPKHICLKGLALSHSHFFLMGNYHIQDTKIGGRAVYRHSQTKPPIWIWWKRVDNWWCVGSSANIGSNVCYMFTWDLDAGYSPINVTREWTLYSNRKWSPVKEVRCEKMKTRQITFEPGPLGFEFFNGIVREIDSQYQASLKGVSPCWKIIEINNKLQGNNDKRLMQAINKTWKKNQPTIILFQEPMQKKVTLSPDPVGITFEGNQITRIEPGSQASKNGIPIGWRILKVENKLQKDNAKVIGQALDKQMELGKSTTVLFVEDLALMDHRRGVRIHKEKSTQRSWCGSRCSEPTKRSKLAKERENSFILNSSAAPSDNKQNRGRMEGSPTQSKQVVQTQSSPMSPMVAQQSNLDRLQMAFSGPTNEETELAHKTVRKLNQNESWAATLAKQCFRRGFSPYVVFTLCREYEITKVVDGKQVTDFKREDIFVHRTKHVLGGGSNTLFHNQHNNCGRKHLHKPWRENQRMYLKVLCWKKDFSSADNLIGMKKLEVTRAFRKGHSRFNVHLETSSKHAGVIEVKLTYMHMCATIEIIAGAGLVKPGIKHISNREAWQSIWILVFLIGVALTYFSFVEQWEIHHTIYFIFMCVSFVGYGDHQQFKHSSSYLFSAIYMLVGLIVIARAVTVIVQYVIDHKEAEEDNMLYDIDAIKRMEGNPNEVNNDSKEEPAEDASKRSARQWKRFYEVMGYVISSIWFIAVFCSLVIITMNVELVQPPGEDVSRLLKLDEALYFVVVTITMIGFGDFKPGSEESRGFAMVWIAIGILSMVKFSYDIMSVLRYRRMKTKNAEILKAAFSSKSNFVLFDENGDGVISELEFLVKMLSRLKLCHDEDVHEILDAFRKMDKDDSGEVDIDELIDYIKEIREEVLPEQNSLDGSRREPPPEKTMLSQVSGSLNKVVTVSRRMSSASGRKKSGSGRMN